MFVKMFAKIMSKLAHFDDLKRDLKRDFKTNSKMLLRISIFKAYNILILHLYIDRENSKVSICFI